MVLKSALRLKSSVQSWIHMEEELEQYKRAEKLMKARLTGAAPPVAPMSFLTPDSLSSPAEPSLLENVVTTVSPSLA